MASPTLRSNIDQIVQQIVPGGHPATTPMKAKAVPGAKHPAGGNLPFKQSPDLEGVLKDVGFKGQHLAEAEGIAWAESNLDAAAKSKNPDGGTNVGLFQIDQKAHPAWTVDQLLNPTTNAEAAYQISKGGTDWGAWETWVNGAWKAKAGKNGKIGHMVPGDPVSNPADLIPDPLKNLVGMSVEFMKKLMGLFYPAAWKRIGLVVFGFVAVLWGLHALLKGSFGVDVVGSAKRTAVKAAEVAAVVPK